MFQIRQTFEFCYGHRLLGYEGKCRHLHGHNGRVEVVLESPRLDDRGMVVDFGELKRKLRTWVEQNLDHRMILRRDDPAAAKLCELGEPVVLLQQNPTAENLAKLIFEQARQLGLPVVAVSLWETSSSCATWRAD